MTRAEIRKKFDEIVAFAEVEKFFDTPVKHYTSGMYVRLAFAVAAHLEPEILIVDEVLAVGDAEFQKKCLGKMGEVARGGRTVLFVSHNMNAVQDLCTKALVIESGRVRRFDEDVQALTTEYLFGKMNPAQKPEWVNNGDEHGSPYFKLLRFAICDAERNTVSSPITNNRPVWVQIEGQIDRFDPMLTVGYAAYSESGQILYWSYQTDGEESRWPRLGTGAACLRADCPRAF